VNKASDGHSHWFICVDVLQKCSEKQNKLIEKLKEDVHTLTSAYERDLAR